MNIKEVAEIVENEGLGYAVQHYMSSDDIENKALKSLWDIASAALKAIDNMLEPYRDGMK